MIKKTALFLSIALCAGCTRKDASQVDWQALTTPAKAEVLNADTSLYTGIDNPIMHHNIIIGEQRNSKSFKICQLSDDSIRSVGEFLSIGKGPYEMLYPRLQWNFKENYLFLCDYFGGQNKIIYIPTGNIDRVPDVDTWEVSEFTSLKIKDKPIYPDQLKCIEKDIFISNTAYNSDKMYTLVDNIHGETRSIDFDYPDDGSEIPQMTARNMAYFGLFQKHPYENKFVFFSLINRYMLITEYKNGEMKEIASPYKIYPKYHMAKDGQNILPDKECYLGAINVYPTSRYIYVLMNEATWNDERNKQKQNGYGPHHSNEVYVFNWKGEPVRKYLLDYQVDNIWVDENDQNLYASTQDMEKVEKGTIFLRYSQNDL